MQEMYKKSLQMIKEKNIKDIKEYTKLAKKENLLSFSSLEYISGMEFNNLIKQTYNRPKFDTLFDTLNSIKSVQNRLNRRQK